MLKRKECLVHRVMPESCSSSLVIPYEPTAEAFVFRVVPTNHVIFLFVLPVSDWPKHSLKFWALKLLLEQDPSAETMAISKQVVGSRVLCLTTLAGTSSGLLTL